MYVNLDDNCFEDTAVANSTQRVLIGSHVTIASTVFASRTNTDNIPGVSVGHGRLGAAALEPGHHQGVGRRGHEQHGVVVGVGLVDAERRQVAVV